MLYPTGTEYVVERVEKWYNPVDLEQVVAQYLIFSSGLERAEKWAQQYKHFRTKDQLHVLVTQPIKSSSSWNWLISALIITLHFAVGKTLPL